MKMMIQKNMKLATVAYLLAMTIALDVAGAVSAPAAGTGIGDIHEGHSAADCANHGHVKQQVGGQASEGIRVRRQATAGALPAPAPGESGKNFFSMLSELGPQVEKAKALSTLFSSSSSGSSLPSSSPFSSTGVVGQPASSSPGQLMSSLSELIRSTQDNNAKVVADTQQSVQQAAQQAQQQTAQAAQSAQGGIQAALTEIGQGLQRIASNNPSLLPDVKNLYQSVSTKLSSASTSVAQAAPVLAPPKSSEQQLADNLAKVIASPPAA